MPDGSFPTFFGRLHIPAGVLPCGIVMKWSSGELAVLRKACWDALQVALMGMARSIAS